MRKNPARGCDVVKSVEQLKRSEVPDCRSGRTGHGAAICVLRAHPRAASALRGSGGHPACRRGRHLAARTDTQSFEHISQANDHPAGRDARLHGRQDARRYVVAVPGSSASGALLLSFLHSWLPLAQAAETNSSPASPAPAIRRPPPSPQEVAAAHERAGRKREAAALYEAMVRTNTAARKVLSHRLVAIYAETGETNKALTWAREVMRDNPDPQAYLAAVQARLGQWQEAQETLEREIARNTNATRAVTLRWQLAEVCEKQGDAAKARKVLNEAADAAKGTPMESAAQRRLNALK